MSDSLMGEKKYTPPHTFFALNDDWDGKEYPEIVNEDVLRIVPQWNLTESQLEKVVNFSKKFNSSSVVIPHHFFPNPNKDISWLKYIPNLNSFALHDHQFNSFDDFDFLPNTLESLKIGDTKSKRLSLSFLKKFKNLKNLSIEKHKKDINVISELKSLERLQLRSITLPDLEVLLPLKNLAKFELKLGGTKNLDALSKLKKLKYLELWSILKLDNIDVISEITSLEYLFLDSLNNIETVKSLQSLKKLKIVYLNKMKGIKDLGWVADAPNIEKFLFVEANQMAAKEYECLKRCKNLEAVQIWVKKKEEKALKDLGLPIKSGLIV